MDYGLHLGPQMVGSLIFCRLCHYPNTTDYIWGLKWWVPSFSADVASSTLGTAAAKEGTHLGPPNVGNSNRRIVKMMIIYLPWYYLPRNNLFSPYPNATDYICSLEWWVPSFSADFASGTLGKSAANEGTHWGLPDVVRSNRRRSRKDDDFHPLVPSPQKQPCESLS